MDMIADKSFEHDGKRFTRGEAFDATPVEAASFRYRKLAHFASEHIAPVADRPKKKKKAASKQREAATRRDVEAQA